MASQPPYCPLVTLREVALCAPAPVVLLTAISLALLLWSSGIVSLVRAVDWTPHGVCARVRLGEGRRGDREHMQRCCGAPSLIVGQGRWRQLIRISGPEGGESCCCIPSSEGQGPNQNTVCACVRACVGGCVCKREERKKKRLRSSVYMKYSKLFFCCNGPAQTITLRFKS